ncbi:putative pumilio homolog 8, chloroplastic [Phalaenopsis equestris]|uniref:putative pumilio homolog 8, chloroplastic n=1 Tax=Phalaenopsis equestris TaxID=78828 RepID=UPI0009E4DC07|nr:putative pumilio homolog 8, chloroplastic [Phalaenopsis equestris]
MEMEIFINELLDDDTYPASPPQYSTSSAIENIVISNPNSSSDQSDPPISFGYNYGSDIAGFSDASSSGSNSNPFGPSQAEAELCSPEMDSLPRNASAKDMYAIRLLQTLQALQIQEGNAGVRSAATGADFVYPHSLLTVRKSLIPHSAAFDKSRGSSSWVDCRLQCSSPMSCQSQYPTSNYSNALNPNKALNETESRNGFPLNPNTLNLLNSQDSSVITPRNTEDYGCEGSFIIQGNDISNAGSNALGFSAAKCSPQINAHMDAMVRLSPAATNPDVKRSIYHLAKDQNGCRLLYQKINEGNAYEIATIFNGIIGHVIGLMENPFGNYLIQKIISICTDQQRIRIVQILTEDPYVFIRVAINTHGTRAVQKLIATIKTRYEANLLIKALIPTFVKLIKDVNGSHVIQSCLTSLTGEYNKFIFDTAARNCVDIARHRYGCRVLHACITHSSGDQQTKLIAEISANGLDLAKDAFGNYTVQFILDLHNPTANANLILQFKGNYVDLSKQKFSSNVVEKCIEVFEDDDRTKLILELLYSSEFRQLLEDPYANYVIQSALTVTKDCVLHSLIVQAIRPHAEQLKSCPYFKQINKMISGI